jgi:integrase
MTQKPWEAKEGKRPNLVVAYERLDRGGVIYVRYTDESLSTADRRIRRPLPDAPVIRDRHGKLIPKNVREVERLLREFHARILLKTPMVDAPPQQRPLTIAKGIELALDLTGQGKYATKTRRWEEVERAARRLERILGAATPWESVTPSAVRNLWRTLAKEARHATGETTVCGCRQTEVTVDAFYGIATWLREENHIGQAVAVPMDKWRQKLKDEWAQITESSVGNKVQPRHTPLEVSAIFRALSHSDVDPRFATVFALGGEQRIGQVLRCRRSDLDFNFGRRENCDDIAAVLNVPSAGKKHTAPIGLNEAFLCVVNKALSGYLSELETAYKAGDLADYPLFPAGRLVKGVAKVRLRLQPLNRSAALKMFRKVERLAGVPTVLGRGWYGVRRTATDLAEDVETDERVLNSISGHRDSKTRRLKYQQNNRPEVLAQAAAARQRLRERGAASAQQPVNSSDSGTHSGTQTQTPESRPLGRLHKLCFINDLRERATGLEPATSSLGSWHSTN